MSADPQQHDTPDPDQGHDDQPQPPKHPFYQAWETWEAWSMANTMRFGLRQARERGNDELAHSIERHPEWTSGPSVLAALRANHELVDRLSGWRSLTIREAREQGHGWHEIGDALDISAEVARRSYLERVEQQRRLATEDPELGRLIGYEPRLAELAEPNDADRAHQAGLAEPGWEGGHER